MIKKSDIFAINDALHNILHINWDEMYLRMAFFIFRVQHKIQFRNKLKKKEIGNQDKTKK